LIAYWAGKFYLELGLILSVASWWRLMPVLPANTESPGLPAWRRAFVWVKNLAFFLIFLLLVRGIQAELARLSVQTGDWTDRIALMQAAVWLAGAGLFGLFAEAPWPDLNSKWAARFDAVNVLLFGGWLVFILRPPNPFDECKDAVALLVIFGQARVGRSLLSVMEQLRAESGGQVEFNNLKF
jgi:hypothetical protein